LINLKFSILLDFNFKFTCTLYILINILQNLLIWERKNNLLKKIIRQFYKIYFYYMLMINKKAISPVVATALLLVVAVSSVVGFQGWFSEFSSSMFVDVETQSSGQSSVSVEAIVGDKLYINSKNNVSISSIKINNNDCNINSSVNGLDNFNISDCIQNVSGSANIVVVTNSGIYENYKYISGDSIYLSVPAVLDCSTLNGGEWSLVPGDATYGTSDFCVMKYEARWNGSGTINNSGLGYCGNGNDYNVTTGCPLDGSVGVESKAADTPLSKVNQFEAIELCKTLGPHYHLITNNEWMTIARDIEQVSSNWADGTVGSTVASGGGLKRGNNGETGTNVGYNGINPESGVGRDTKALLNLSNGDGIWDLSGNVWEWTNDTFNSNSESALGQGSDGYKEWNIIGPSWDYLKPFNSSLTSTNGIGQVYVYNQSAFPSGNTHAFLRGGGWNNGADAGAFALRLDYAPSYASTGIGFRCSFAP
jgi:flagellin-like protein